MEKAGRDAIAELRLMLGMLREPAELSPPGTLDDLVGRAGFDVRLSVAGPPRDLPPGADVSVYRIVQEALTNVRKHAERHPRRRDPDLRTRRVHRVRHRRRHRGREDGTGTAGAPDRA